RGRDKAPADFDAAVERWRQLHTDPGATYDRSEVYRGEDIQPQVTWGTNPGQVQSIADAIPDPASMADPTEQKSAAQALEYMGLRAGTPMTDVAINRVFIGSCTNAR